MGLDPQQARIRRNARARVLRAIRRAEANSPEAEARRKRWEQDLANIGQCAIEERENMPDELRILTGAGNATPTHGP